MRAFVDTNLWAYRLDRRDPGKSAFIRDWLRSLAEANDIVISTQVMIELRSVLTRKLEPALSPADTRRALEALAGFDVVSTARISAMTGASPASGSAIPSSRRVVGRYETEQS
jgi:predicted nucleic acid-binding protein